MLLGNIIICFAGFVDGSSANARQPVMVYARDCARCKP